MSADDQRSVATWWKATRYELHNGTHIRPAPDAKIERYDVLKASPEYWMGRGPAAPAYVRLQDVDLSDEESVLDWCSEFGLLGLLHHRLVSVAFWPTWERRFSLGMERLKPHQRILWEAQSWDHFAEEVVYSEGPTSESDRSLEGAPLEESELRGTWDPVRPPKANIRTMDERSDVRSVSIVEGVGQFFPHIPGISEWVAAETRRRLTPARPGGDRIPPRSGDEPSNFGDLNRQRFPLTDTEDFLRSYGEPWYLFQDVARRFQLPAEVDRYPDAFIADELPKLLGHVSPRAALSTEGWIHSWQTPSLISAMAVMILQDLILENVRIPSCNNCGNRFVTKQWNKKYCTEGCKNAAEMRRYRATKRQEKEDLLDRLEENYE